MKSIISLLLSLSLLLSYAVAFAPSPVPHRAVTFQKARKISGFKPTHSRQTIVLRMSSEEEKTKPKKGEAFYDDEYDSAPKKEGISDSMKQRLLAEASTGLDSEKKQNNVILYIIAAVGVLVVLGGQGVFY